MFCSADGCQRESVAKGLCLKHYRRLWRRSKPNWARRFERTVMERFLAKVRKTPTCWVWTGASASNGYGSMGVNGKTVPAYRVAYELFKGIIPPGYAVDHLCRNRICVNPDHLEAVTVAENNRRSGRVKAARSHCSKGHPFIPANIRWVGHSRYCKTCERIRKQRWLDKHPHYARDYQRRQRTSR